MFTLANVLTLVRIIISPLVILLALYPDNITINITVLLIFIGASITDYYDGKIARQNKEITELGKLLDPIADKIMIGICLGVFLYLHEISKLTVIIILSREILITLHRLITAEKQHKIIAASWFGKVKTGLQITMIISILIKIILGNRIFMTIPNFTIFLHYFNIYIQLTVFSTVIITVSSGIDYILYNITLLYTSKLSAQIGNIFSTVLGVGYLPKAPGTWASLLTIFTLYFLSYRFPANELNILLLYVFFIFFFLGVITSSMTEYFTQKKDNSIIVIDEVVGQILPFIWLPHDNIILELVVIFILFRFFDIVKPLKIDILQKFPKGWGIMLDDVLAGIYTGIIAKIFFSGAFL